MRKVAIAVACVAYTGHGQGIRMPSDEHHSDPGEELEELLRIIGTGAGSCADVDHSNRLIAATDASKPLHALRRFLLVLNSANAFAASSAATYLRVRSHGNSIGVASRTSNMARFHGRPQMSVPVVAAQKGETDEEHLASMLSKSDLDIEQLPADVLEALKAGRIGKTELRNYRVVLSNPVSRGLAAVGFIRNRLLAETRLPTVLRIECFIGCLALLMAEILARGDAFLMELDFVLANQVMVVLTNLVLVLALTPAAPVSPPPARGSLAAYMASLPGYFLQKGAFSVRQRVICFISKALLFGILGSIASALGQALTLGLMELRTILNPAQVCNLAPVLPTAAAYAIFMAVSSNTRYQVVNSLEGNLLPLVPGGRSVQEFISYALRSLNNYLGSMGWIWWAKRCCLQ